MSYSVNYLGNNQGFLAVPTDIATFVVKVYLADNMITQIKDSDFQTLTSVIRIDLSNNKITNVSRLGSRCTNLESISLRKNLLTSIPVDIFQDCDKLLSVSLVDNNLTTVDWIKH